MKRSLAQANKANFNKLNINTFDKQFQELESMLKEIDQVQEQTDL